MTHVLVVGGGIAGVAAALAARDAGADVTLVRASAGATELGTGALDDAPWEDARAPVAVDALARSVLDRLGGYAVGPERALVATTGATLRGARGVDAALLDLAALPHGAKIGVPVFEREGWDGRLVARGLEADPLGRARSLTFVPAPASIATLADERVVPDVEIAARHDDPARLSTLAARLRDAKAEVDAWLLPPWLGVAAPRAAELAKLVGIPCGEVITLPPSPAGARFSRARDRALATAKVSVVLDRVEAIEREASLVVARLEEGEPIAASAAVIAIGGLVAGGVAYAPSEALLATALPRHPRPAFVLGLDADVSLGVGGHPLVVPGSMFGVQPESIAWPMHAAPVLEHVGVLVDGELRAGEGVWAAGDVVADRPRTFLEALASGARAGRAAAG